jgi:hypothetical protein
MQGAQIDNSFGQIKLTDAEKQALADHYKPIFGDDLLKRSEHLGVLIDSGDFLGVLWIFDALALLVREAAALASKKRNSMLH